MTALAALALLIWAYLLTLHGRFWSAGPTLSLERPSCPGLSRAPTPLRHTPATTAEKQPFHPSRLPEPNGVDGRNTSGQDAFHAAGAPPIGIDIVIPARDEAPSIHATLLSLLAQTYPAPFHITLVDDQSTDATNAIAKSIPDPRLTVIDGQPRPQGWSGKLWALHQGIAATSAPLILLTDADIVHDPGHLAALVATLQPHRHLVSGMVELRCHSLAERALVPAFVFFFQLLYPFAHVNDPAHRTAAAAGGTILLRRDTLERSGGITSLRGALIDDVTLAARIKPLGPIWLGHTQLARSVRPYPGPADIWRMVARTAYVQLRHSPLLLLGTVLGLALVWLVPPALTLLAHGPARWMAALAWAASAASYLPTLRRVRQSPIWALALPAIATFYMAATLGSALDHHRGRGVRWKNRAYQGAQP